MPLKPRAYRLDDPDTAVLPHGAGTDLPRAAIVVTEEPMDAIQAADGAVVIAPPRRRSPLWSLFVSAVGGLASLAIGLGVERLVSDLFTAAPWLGWVAVGLLVIAGLSLLGILGREMAGLFRERRIEALRQAAAETLAVRDGERARTLVAELTGLYAARTDPHRAASLAAAADDIMDAEDRLAMAERVFVAPLDERATRAVATAAKQVSVVTALSPRAIVDVVFVIVSAVRLLRRVATLYGGRPGFFGFMRLARAALNHLAVTGGVAVGDSLMQQVLGLGLAARVSAKLGEGVLNGLMTARFGLAAIQVCRPLPYIRETPPRLADVAGGFLSRSAEP